VLEPEVMVYEDEDWGSKLAPTTNYRGFGRVRFAPHEMTNIGSVSLTTGNRRRFRMYTTWLKTVSAERPNGNLSTIQRRICRAITT